MPRPGLKYSTKISKERVIKITNLKQTLEGIKMGERIPEYFLPIEASEFYERQKRFYSSCIEDKKTFDEKLGKCDWGEFIYSVPGKFIPDAVSLTAIIYSINNRSILPLGIVALSEFTRAYFSKRFEKTKKEGLEVINEETRKSQSISSYEERGWIG